MVNAIMFIAMLNSQDTDWWFLIIVGLFWLFCLAIGMSLLTLFFRKRSSGPLLLGTDFIEIPGRWKSKKRVLFAEIEEVNEFNTYDHVIELNTANGFHMIERNWMKKADFEQVRIRLENLMEQRD